MENVFTKNIFVKILMEDGEKVETGKKMSGVGVLSEGEIEFTFTKGAKREKSYAHNPTQYVGNHTTARLLKNSDFRLTTMVSSNYDLTKDDNIDAIVSEVREALYSIRA